VLVLDGERPLSPVNLTASWEPDNNTIHVSWNHPSTQSPSLPVSRYEVQYRTVGRWVTLATVSVNITSYRWTTASRGATYHFRVFSVAGGDIRSKPSPTVSFATPGLTVTTRTGIIKYLLAT